MFGLVVLLIMFGYLAVAVTATVLTVRRVKRSGGSRRNQWVRGGIVALIFYLIPFWDAIPTWVVYSYMCHTEAGIVVRKDIEKWKSENDVSLPTIQRTREAERFRRIDGVSRYQMNTRIAVDNFPFESIFLSVRKVRASILDTGNGEILVTKQDFVSGSRFGSDSPEGMKIWLRRESCTEGVGGIQSKFSEILASYERVVGEIR